MKEDNYNLSNINSVPEGWLKTRLGEICKIYRGGSPRPIEDYITTSNDGINWIKIGDVDKYAKYIYKTEEKISPKGMLHSRCVQNGDFLLSNSMSFGRPYILKTSGCIHDGWLVIQDYSKACDCNFLYYALSSNYILQQYRAKAAGSSVLNLNKEIVSSVEIKYPKDILEQKTIASALSSIDNLIDALDKLIEKKKLTKQGAMQELLTGKKRLPGFKEEWQEYSLGEALQYEQPTAYLVEDTEYMEKGIPVLTAGKSFILGYTSEKKGVYNKGDVIIFDDFTTDSKYVTFPFKAKSSAMKILTAKSGFVLRFMYDLLSTVDFNPSDHMRHWIRVFSKIVVKIPLLEEQKAIASVLSSMDKEIESLEAKREKYISIKQGMMQQLLTGKVRLI